MKKTRHVYRTLLVLSLLSVVFFSGCMSGPERYPKINNESSKAKEYEGPETHGLVFGYVSREKGLLSLTEPQIPTIEFAQINPEGEAMFVSPGRAGSFFFIQPVPVGSTLHLIYYSYQSGRTIYYGYEGIQKGYDLTVNVDQPGLHYAGSYLLTTTEKPEGIFDSPSDFGFHPIGEHTELEALEDLLRKMKKTEWEALITARIEEVSDEE